MRPRSLPLFKKILIANRGEIAVRVIRACKELDIESIAVYSVADKDSLHVKLADQAICIGPGDPTKSYLSIPAIISAAEISGAEAIHPGYGFLSENADFSEICEANGIAFIGASPENIRLMGDKSSAKDTMKKLNVPVVPGSDGVVKDEEDLKKIAKETGYPLLIKASAGGGGRGMRVVNEESQLVSAYKTATNEAINAFGNGDVYVEKLILKPRHVEIQILADKTGHAIHLGERDCSIQRRHQKLIEEAPSPVLDEVLREKMGSAAVRAAQGIKYQGAGTVEFLVDKDQNFYFMEMNTRIQVEHPVTEMVTGIDLIKQQISIAATNKLDLTQEDVSFSGHAIEFRINAEDHEKGFIPSPGKISLFFPPGGKGIRNDSYVYPEYVVTPNYDSLIGKLVVWGRDRDEAIKRSRRALEEYAVEGIKTTIPFHQIVLDNEQFVSGDFDTHFVDDHF